MENIIRIVLPSDITLFITTFLFCLTAFHFMKQIVTEDRVPCKWFFVLFSLINAGVVLILEQLGDGRTSSVIMAVIPAVIVPQVAIVSRGKWWPYLNLYFMATLELLCFYSFGCAIINLGMHNYWTTGSDEHRYAIFSLTMLLNAVMFRATTRSRATPISLLADIVHDTSRSLLLLIYMGISSVVLVISTGSLSNMIYGNLLPRDVEITMHMDIVLKDGLILLCSFLIVVVQILQEQSVRQKRKLELDLKKERDFRSHIQSDALFSYCVNINRNQVLEGMEHFPGQTGVDGSNYSEAIGQFIQEFVHPEDLPQILAAGEISYCEEKLEHDPNYFMRFRMSAKRLLAQSDSRALHKIFGHLTEEREWVWAEFRVTVIRDTGSNDILAYVSLSSVDDEMAEREILQQAANTDPLTGLLNRTGMERAIEKYLMSEDASGTMFLIDMDYFKNVNDRLGHPAGDKALQDTANILRIIFRAEDVIGRLGGDEFYVFAPGLVSEEIAVHRAQQLNKRGTRVYSSADGSKSARVSLSIGGVICLPGSRPALGSLYEIADKALYDAKEAGRNTYRIYIFEEKIG